MPQAKPGRARTLAAILASYASKDRFEDFTLRRSWFGPRLEVHSVECAKALFSKRTQRRFGPFAALAGDGFGHRVMIVADGNEWRRTHEAVAPYLHTAASARDYVTVVQSVAAAAFRELVERSRGAGGEPAVVEVEIEALMRSVATSVMGHVVFGESLPLSDARYLERTLGECTVPSSPLVHAGVNLAVAYVLRLFNLSHRQRFWLPRRQRRAVAALFGWLASKIEATAQAGTHPALLRSLDSRYAERRRPAERKRCVTAECAMIFMAGIETTAAALAFAIAEIASDPSIRDSVTKEARQGSAILDDAALTTGFPLIYRVIRETLRLHTIVPTMLREADEDQEVVGCPMHGKPSQKLRIRRGTILRYLPVRGNLRRDVWPDPLRFDPARFARPLTAEQRKHYHTFGMGPQSCPGRALAITESIVMLREFLRWLDLQTKCFSRPIEVTRTAAFTIRPVGLTAEVRAPVG